MTSQIPEPSRIVILAAIDGSDASSDVIRTSAALAQTLASAELHLVHVVEPEPHDGAVWGLRDLRERVPCESQGLTDINDTCNVAGELVRAAAADARKHFTGKIAAHLAAGLAASEILDVGRELQADLIVVGPRQRTFLQRLGLGSVSEQVVRKATCAVLVARPKHYEAAVEIEPPCADCLALEKLQKEGEVKLWCTRHDPGARHPRARVHYEVPEAFARGSLLLRPEG